MKRTIQRAITAAFGLALIVTIGFPASAQDEMMAGEPSVAADYGKGCCDVCCSSGGIYGDFQYLRLSQYDTGGNFEDVNADDGYRAILGYQNCDGLGVRVRYFTFDGLQQGGEEGLDLSYFDVEVTQSFTLCCLDGVVSAGYRHATYEMREDDNVDSDFEGDGVTVGLSLERELTCNLALFGWAQHSIVAGDDDSIEDNVILEWSEIQLGAQYSTCVGGINAVVRGGVEAQFHDGLSFGDGYESGLMGWFLSAGVNY